MYLFMYVQPAKIYKTGKKVDLRELIFGSHIFNIGSRLVHSRTFLYTIAPPQLN